MVMRSMVIAALIAGGLETRLGAAPAAESKPPNWRHLRPIEITRVQMPVNLTRPEQGSREKQRRLRQLKKREQKS